MTGSATIARGVPAIYRPAPRRVVRLPRLRGRGLGAAGTLAGQHCGAGVLSTAQLVQLALDAGFPSSLASQMATIALRESGGCPTAYNPVAPDNSYGLWQINVLGNPGILAALGLTDPAQLFDPATNAAAAFYLYGGNPSNIGIAWAATAGPPAPASSAGLDLASMLQADLPAALGQMDPTTLIAGAALAGLALAVVLT
jgi:hypothetical protein